MNDRVPGGRFASRSANSSARSSAAFERDYDQHLQPHSQPYSNRYNPSLRSVGSRFSLSDQFAATRREYEFGFDDGASLITTDTEAEAEQDDTLTGAGSFDRVVVIDAPGSHRESGSELRQLRRIRQRLAGNTTPGSVDMVKSQLYCTPPTLTLTSSIFATSEMNSYLIPHSTQGRQPNVGPDALPKDQPLALNIKLRQELFIRAAGLSEAELRRTLPDAVLEIETENAIKLTVRASHMLRLGGDKWRCHQLDEPLHTEASISVTRLWPGASHKPRLGLGLHRHVGGRNGGTVFACADSGTAPFWESLDSSFWNRSVRNRLDRDSTGATWRRYMDYLSQLPSYYSPPTLEVGYKFGSVPEETLGLRSGRAFTKPPGSGMQRLRDNVCLSGPNNRGSWTVSGALTAGGVAGYVRFGRSFLSTRNELEQSLIPSRLRGLRFEAELSTYKSTPSSLLSRVRSLGRSEISQLAVRGLKKIGKSRSLGLEMSVNNATSSVVLSLYFSSRNKSFAVPIVLFRDQPSPYRFLTKILMVAGYIPALALTLFDLFPLLIPQAGVTSEQDEASPSHEIQKYIALRRAEADDLVAVLAEPVSQLQRVQRERRGLVILSAKYGVLDERLSGTPTAGPLAAGGPAAAALHLGPSWASPEEVADVTVALAALVSDDGSLHIPEGLRKSRLLGFWDPKPRRTKCLFVRYMIRGQEKVKEVNGRDELRLP
ncbi:hypothetical protein KVR01_006540 [Diaporthe batatas]|uniref:uncharacterized protein n=1 Tax=Diaporthe batatas TaxID=748121 RepID=UPI001D04B7D1|nr:uncharacterized protein KVR01_006540 [Diaporthe batatas]KAG8163243.1 hypothetical protein KVR01_006540 [Diaporthe batatas]